MSWLSMLNTTYLNAVDNRDAKRIENPLLPISHTTQLADIEVTIDTHGNFMTARILEDKEERQTLIPCTDDSSSRSGPGAKLRPHPLHDKLQYVAGDYVKYGGTKGNEGYEKYIENLAAWSESEFGLPELDAILQYLVKGRLIEDLVDCGILYVDSDNHLLESWDRESEKPPIFKVAAGSPSDAFVSFNLLQPNFITRTNPWDDVNFINSYVDFYESTQSDKGLDYVTGEVRAITTLHPKKIRHTGDSAKLLSTNDKSGFTYRGRFETAEECSQVAYGVSQRAHNALKWLIKKQGTRVGERVFLVWGTGGEEIPDPIKSTQEIADLFALPDDEDFSSEEALAAEFRQALNGAKANLRSDSDVAIMVLDAATPGRMAVTYYREFLSGETNRYFENLSAWHERLAWQNIGYSTRANDTIRFLGAPSLRDIAQVAFGVQRGQFLDLDDKILAQTVQRIFPCVIDQSVRIPGDIVRAAYTNSLYPQKYSDFNWSKVRGVACSLIRADRMHRWKERWSMDVNVNTGDLTYNIGRWMAVLDEIETRALRSNGEQKVRSTSVERYFSKLAERPCSATEIVMKQLVPYRNRLGNKGNRLYQLEQEIASTIDPQEFKEVKNLDGRFLLGYDAQKYAIYRDYAERRDADKKQELENLEIEEGEQE